MKVLILAPATAQGRKHSARVAKILTALGPSIASVQVEEQANNKGALRLIASILMEAAGCDAFFWEPSCWKWGAGETVAEILRKHKMPEINMKRIVSMDDAEGVD